eukprot:scaffold245824_cov33-Tisochrysis_lutea.AAC.5
MLCEILCGEGARHTCSARQFGLSSGGRGQHARERSWQAAFSVECKAAGNSCRQSGAQLTTRLVLSPQSAPTVGTCSSAKTIEMAATAAASQPSQSEKKTSIGAGPARSVARSAANGKPERRSRSRSAAAVARPACSGGE